MKIGYSIYSILINDSDVSALVSTRVYPNVAKQSSDWPFIVYTTNSVDPTDTKDGVSPMDTNIVEILCLSDTYSQAVDLAQKVRIALDRKTPGTYPNTIWGNKVQSIKFNSVDEDFEIDGKGMGVYVQTLSFNIRQVNPTNL